jgi:hypothetical protein
MNVKLDLAISLTEEALHTLQRARRDTYAPSTFAHYWRADEELNKALRAMQQAMQVTQAEWNKHVAEVAAREAVKVNNLAIDIRKALMAITNEAIFSAGGSYHAG